MGVPGNNNGDFVDQRSAPAFVPCTIRANCMFVCRSSVNSLRNCLVFADFIFRRSMSPGLNGV